MATADQPTTRRSTWAWCLFKENHTRNPCGSACCGLRVAMWIAHAGGKFRHDLLEKSQKIGGASWYFSMLSGSGVDLTLRRWVCKRCKGAYQTSPRHPRVFASASLSFHTQESRKGWFLEESFCKNVRLSWLWRSGCQMYCCARFPWAFFSWLTLDSPETTSAKTPFSWFLTHLDSFFEAASLLVSAPAVIKHINMLTKVSACPIHPRI